MKEEMKMKEVKNELMNEKVFYDLKMNGERVLRFVKKGAVVCYEVVNEGKKEDGLRVLKAFLAKEAAEPAGGNNDLLAAGFGAEEERPSDVTTAA